MRGEVRGPREARASRQASLFAESRRRIRPMAMREILRSPSHLAGTHTPTVATMLALALASAAYGLVIPTVPQPPAIVQARAAIPQTSSLLADLPGGLVFPGDVTSGLESSLKDAGSVFGKTVGDAAPVLQKTVNDAAPIIEKTLKEKVAPAVSKTAEDLAPIAQDTLNEVAPQLIKFGKAAAGEIWDVILLPAAQIAADAAGEAAQSASTAAAEAGTAALGQAEVALGSAGSELDKASSQALDPEQKRVLTEGATAVSAVAVPILSEVIRILTPLLEQAFEAGKVLATNLFSQLIGILVQQLDTVLADSN